MQIQSKYYLPLREFTLKDRFINFDEEISSYTFDLTPAIVANQSYFNNSKWAKTYFDACHRDVAFKERWLAVAGSWNDKIVVDIGCGPGNLHATLQENPKLLIGIDVAESSLKMAKKIGYIPLMSDAHDLPLISEFADLVTLNAALHHCEDMRKVLAESARLVRSGGKLVVDHDPQLSAWNYKGIGLWLYKIRLKIIYKRFLRSLYIPDDERYSALATEIHHQPGHGVTENLFREVLEPMGFTVKIYPHNNTIGAKVLEGNLGHPPHWRYRIGQFLSGINPYSKTSALSLMCLAQKS